MTLATRFIVGTFVVDRGRNVVVGPEGEAALEPKIMDVLCLLATHQGEVLSRETIIDAVWGRSFGADESLTRAISQLRKVFGDARSPARVIETISKRGYRLIAPVSLDGEAQTTVFAGKKRQLLFWGLATLILLALLAGGAAFLRRPTAVASGAGDGVNILLRPFEVLGTDKRVTARALSDQVAVALSRASLLHVRKSGRQVDGGRGSYVVHGSVQPLSAGIRVTIEIADPRTGESLWAGNFDRPQPLDATALDELVGAIAGELENRLLGLAKTAIRRKPFDAMRPWELTLLATPVPGSDEVFLRPHTADATLPQRRAIALDPNYAPAHASLAQALAYYALFTRDAPVANMRREAALHARLARGLAPYDAGVLYQLSGYYRIAGDRDAAAAALRRVLVLQPDHPLAQLDLAFVDGLCAPRGHAAAAALTRAIAQLSPDNPVRSVALSHLADVELGLGDYAAAADAAARAHDIVHQTWSGMTLAAALAANGSDASAIRISRQTKLEWPGLDWTRFAATMVPGWCMGGSQQAMATAAFRELGKLEVARPH
ncbi:MAG TPA: winged helix-turn-helix domain-containing protein [Sphingomonas sp.]|nr:winged helix-turn-helix domain-containing protein [Sphingomonas sp.]